MRNVMDEKTIIVNGGYIKAQVLQGAKRCALSLSYRQSELRETRALLHRCLTDINIKAMHCWEDGTQQYDLVS